MGTTVIVTVEGGVVLNVECTPGVTVRVRDYDTPGGDPDMVPDDGGSRYFEYVWGGELAAPGG